MRQVLSLSLPTQTTCQIKTRSAQRGFNSVSGYIKYLLEMDQDLISESELLKTIKQSRKEYKTGKSVKAKSMADFL
jgi:hypothetical protein